MTTNNTLYIDEIREGKQLTKEEETLYVINAKTDPEYEGLVVKSFIRLICRMANEYTREHISRNDLIAEGVTGIKEAIKRFEPERNKRFSTYARWWIKAKMGEYYRRFNRGFEISGAISGKLGKIINATEILEQDLQRRPTPAELAEHLGYKEGYVNFLLKYLIANTSIHELLQEEENNPEQGTLLADNHIDSPVERAMRNDSIEVIRKAISNLTEREKFIIIHRYGLDNGDIFTLEKIGEKTNLTPERIRQLQIGIEEKLRKQMLK